MMLVENRRFILPHLCLALPSGVTPFEFRRDLWHQKTRRISVSCGVKIPPVGCLHLVIKHACDGRTDRQNYDSQDNASIAASRGKIQPDNTVRWCVDGDFLAIFCVPYFQRGTWSTFQTCILNSH